MTTKKTYHGGAFFNAIGTDFSTLYKANEVINADVLDAWFDPSPKIVKKAREYMEFIIKTSPPTHCEGLIKTIAEKRGIGIENIIVNGGSSDIIFSIFPRLVNDKSKILILDPMYSEYGHIFEHITQSNLFRHKLKKEDEFVINIESLKKDIKQENPDMIVFVNPNSPTGKYCEKEKILNVITSFPKIQFVVDETYIDYVDGLLSLEKDACKLDNLIIIKSMSKVYALSGVRVAYMVSNKDMVENLVSFIPLWSVSLLGQIAGVEALKDEEYYKKKYIETHKLREKFIQELSIIPGIKIYDSVGNFFLIELKNSKLGAASIIENLREHNIFIRNGDFMSEQFDDNFIRIAVKDEKTNAILINALKKIWK